MTSVRCLTSVSWLADSRRDTPTTCTVPTPWIFSPHRHPQPTPRLERLIGDLPGAGPPFAQSAARSVAGLHEHRRADPFSERAQCDQGAVSGEVVCAADLVDLGAHVVRLRRRNGIRAAGRNRTIAAWRNRSLTRRQRTDSCVVGTNRTSNNSATRSMSRNRQGPLGGSSKSWPSVLQIPRHKRLPPATPTKPSFVSRPLGQGRLVAIAVDNPFPRQRIRMELDSQFDPVTKLVELPAAGGLAISRQHAILGVPGGRHRQSPGQDVSGNDHPVRDRDRSGELLCAAASWAVVPVVGNRASWRGADFRRLVSVRNDW